MLPRLLYNLLTLMAIPGQLINVWGAKSVDLAYRSRLRERLGQPTISHCRQRPLVWVHAHGEQQAEDACRLIKELQRTLPDLQFLVTTTTPEASALIQDWSSEVLHQCMPFDLISMQRRLLLHYQPRMVLIVERGVRPNLVQAANECEVPVILMNAHISARSLRRYQRFSKVFRPAYQGLTQVMAQTSKDQRRLLELGVNPQRIQVTGNLEYDLALSLREQQILPRLRSQYDKKAFLVAGHLYPGEEEVVIAAFAQLQTQHPDLILVLHPKRCKQVARKLTEQGIAHVNYQADLPADTGERIWLLESPLHLHVFYSVAKIALIGGSWVDQGSQNPLEPAMLSVPIITGPSTFNFSPVSEHLQRVGALQVVKADDLAAAINRWLSDEPARRQAGHAGFKVVNPHRGAKRRQAYGIQRLFSS